MILVGAVLLAGVGAYYGYGVYAHSSLDDLNYAVEAPASLPTDAEGEGFVPAGIEVGAVKATVPVGALALAAPEAAEPSAGPSRSALPRQNPISVSSYALIYPGSVMHPKYWGQPLWAGSDPYPTEDGGLPQVVSSPEQEFSQEAAPVASRILIPMIGVDSEVQELQILDLEQESSATSCKMPAAAPWRAGRFTYPHPDDRRGLGSAGAANPRPWK